MPSNIVASGDQKAIQDAFSLLRGIQNDTSISNLYAVSERMLSLYKKTPTGTPTGPETKAIINQMMGEIPKFASSLGNISDAYPKFATFLQDNIPARKFINDARELFGSSANLSPKEATQITTRVLQLFNQGKSDIRNFAENVSAKTGTDLVGTSAGTLIKSGGSPVTVRAPELSAPGRAITTKILEAIPRSIVQSYVKTGNLTTLSQHPVISGIAKLLGLSAIDVAKEIGSMMSQQN
jgi:hypothetical protein